MIPRIVFKFNRETSLGMGLLEEDEYNLNKI